MMMVQVDRLCKLFPPIRAVDEISFTANRQDILGFLGPNGAGKSTTMKMLTCFLHPSSGDATICGHSIRHESIEVRKRIGYVPENSPLYGEMRVEEFLSFVAQMRSIAPQEQQQAIDRVVSLCSLNDVYYQTIETLSKGFKKRVSLAQSLIHNPDVLILDEPTDGLDPNQKFEMRAMIHQLAADKCIILSTHILEEVEALCNRVVIIAKGKLVYDGSRDEFVAKSTSGRIDDVFRAMTTSTPVEGVQL